MAVPAPETGLEMILTAAGGSRQRLRDFEAIAASYAAKIKARFHQAQLILGITPMDISVKALEEAVSIRRQIDNLERRLSSILSGHGPGPGRGPTPPAPTQAGRYFSPSTRAKLSAAARARWARLKGGTKPARIKKKGGLTPADRRKLSELMKARWAARRKVAGTKTAPSAKKGGLTPAGRRRLSQVMKARWAARKKTGASHGPGPGRRLLRRS